MVFEWNMEYVIDRARIFYHLVYLQKQFLKIFHYKNTVPYIILL